MTFSLILLSVLTCLPDQTSPSRKLSGPYHENQSELLLIHEDLLRLKDDVNDEIMALNDQVRELRERDSSLLSRLQILRQSARTMDCYCQQALERIRQWEKLNSRRPDPGVEKLFHTVFVSDEIVKKRALVRKLFYMEIMNFRWNGETRRPFVHFRIMDGLSTALTNGDHDKLLLGFAWVDLAVTEVVPFLNR